MQTRKEQILIKEQEAGRHFHDKRLELKISFLNKRLLISYSNNTFVQTWKSDKKNLILFFFKILYYANDTDNMCL